MKRFKPATMTMVTALTIATFVSMVGCAPVVYDRDPDWDGRLGYDNGYAYGPYDYGVFGYGGYGFGGGGFDRGHYHGHDGGDRDGDRGRASMGPRFGGSGGHFSGGGGGGHAGGGGGGGGGHR